jgi:hypothetical protein
MQLFREVAEFHVHFAIVIDRVEPEKIRSGRLNSARIHECENLSNEERRLLGNLPTQQSRTNRKIRLLFAPDLGWKSEHADFVPWTTKSYSEYQSDFRYSYGNGKRKEQECA